MLVSLFIVWAAILDVKLSHLDEDIALRKTVAKRYVEGIKNPKISDWKRHGSHIFPVLRELHYELQIYLEANGVGTNIHYLVPPYKQECYKEWNGMSFPMSSCLTDEQVAWVIDCVNRF